MIKDNKNPGRKSSWNISTISLRYSLNRILTNYLLIALGTMQSNFSLEQKNGSTARSTLCPKMSRNNLTSSWKNNYALDVFGLLNPQWLLLFSLSRRKMENFVWFKITKS